MNLSEAPTKGNLMAAKNSLALAKQGYDLMDRKRNILIRELMDLIDKARDIQAAIDSTFREAYENLEQANIEMGNWQVYQVARTIPEEESVRIKVRSVMGTEIPLVEYDKQPEDRLRYAFNNTSEAVDKARECFNKVKELVISLAMIENTAYRLAVNIKKTQKRANALQNITIPATEEVIRVISDALEEKEREEFIRLKVIKREMIKKR